MTLRFTRGDLVLSAPGYSPGCWAITHVDPSRPKNQYNALNVVNGKLYRLSDAGLSVKIGTATEDFLRGQTALPNPQVEQGRARAQREARVAFGPDKARWEALAQAQPGDEIQILNRGRTERARFQYVNPNGAKYVFAATNGNGTTYRYPLHMLLLPQAAPRPDAQILADLQSVEVALSPEALSGDGEFPSHLILARRRDLEARRAALLQELGRTPTMAELFPETARLLALAGA